LNTATNFLFFVHDNSLVTRAVFSGSECETTKCGSRNQWLGEAPMWDQIYDPLNSKFLSTCAAALPVVTLLVLIASNKVKAHIAALIALVVANFIAIVVFTMPADVSLRATILGAITGFFPIGLIALDVIFL